MARYEKLMMEADPFDLMCSDCEVHYIEYFKPVTEQELREQHQQFVEEDAGMPDWVKDADWEPTNPNFDEWLAESISRGFTRIVEEEAV